MAKNKKPTMMEVKNVLSNIIQRHEMVEMHLDQIDKLFAAFIEYKKDTKPFQSWLEAQSKEDKNAKKRK